MNDLGTVTRSADGGYVLHYERVFDKPPEQVWAALTDPAILTRWLARSDVDLRIGGRFVIYFFDGRETMRGEIRALEPERLIEYSWEEDETPLSSVRWTIAPDGNGSRVTLTHILPAQTRRDVITELGGGWHAILGYLRTALTGDAITPDLEQLPALEARYETLLKQTERTL
jgi:uncharacterized protein YndB with AHSA1/START domain